MDWTEESRGIFVKEFGGVEKIYRHISQAFKSTGREHWGLYCVCTLETEGSFQGRHLESALREAWKSLGHFFPGLAVIPDGISKKKHAVADASGLEAWASETFIVEKETDPDGILASYPLKDLPSMHFVPQSSQIVFLASHWRIDGIGTIMLLDRFFSFLANGSPTPTCETWTRNLDRISPSLEDAVGALDNAERDPELEAFARNYIDDHHRNAVHSGGLPYRGDETTPPGQAARTAMIINQASTTALVAACKERGISVTSAVHAALAEAVFALSHDSAERYSAVISVNMRSHLAPPYDGRDHAVQTYVMGVTPSVARSTSWQGRAQQLTAFYKEGWYSTKLVRAMRLIYQYHSDALFKAKPRADGVPPPKPPSNVLISSLGVVDKVFSREHGKGARFVRVTDFRFGVSMMTRQLLLYVWTFAGKLNLSVNYNDAYHGEQGVRKFLGFIVDVLQKELDVSLESEN
ncbi:hypothetical protein DL765_008910 [Monosporascus sp. GIB2]|nr:hypothetical protein DL765_008910 [Monosporascus sp. GIB2]